MNSRQPGRIWLLATFNWEGSYTDGICFVKAEGNLLKFLCLVNFKGCSWVHLKEKMQAEFSKVETASHASLALMHCKQKHEKILTVIIYRWSELLMQCCGIWPEHCRDKFKIHLFSCQLSNKKIAMWVIRKHPESVAHAFHIAKEEEIELRILDRLSEDNVYLRNEPKFKMVLISPFKIMWYSRL